MHIHIWTQNINKIQKSIHYFILFLCLQFTFPMSLFGKYNNTAAQIFKIRMQFKAEINDLRKTYQQVVLQKPEPKKKIFQDKLTVKTTLLPEQIKTLKKTPQKRHFSPSPQSQLKQKSSLSCKRQFANLKNSNTFSKALKQEINQKKKSLSPFINPRHNVSMTMLSSHNESTDGLKVGLNDRSLSKENRPSKRIIAKYHQYNYGLLLG